MAIFPLGTEITLTATIRDVDGELADVTDMSCTVNDEAQPVNHASTGIYVVTYLPAAAGDYEVAWEATGDNACVLYQQFSVTAYAAAVTAEQVMEWLPDDMDDEEKNRWITMYADPHCAAGRAWQSWAARLRATDEESDGVTSVSTGAQSIGYGTPSSSSLRAMNTANWHFARCGAAAVLSPDYNHTPAVPLSQMLPPTWKEV